MKNAIKFFMTILFFRCGLVAADLNRFMLKLSFSQPHSPSASFQQFGFFRRKKAADLAEGDFDVNKFSVEEVPPESKEATAL